MTDLSYHGACLCGNVKLVATGKPASVAACHCPACRRHTGAPAAVYVDYPVKQVSLTGATLQHYQSSAGTYRGFCNNCGSTVSYQANNQPDMLHIHLGVFNDPTPFNPTENENIETKLPWICISVDG